MRWKTFAFVLNQIKPIEILIEDSLLKNICVKFSQSEQSLICLSNGFLCSFSLCALETFEISLPQSFRRSRKKKSNERLYLFRCSVCGCHACYLQQLCQSEREIMQKFQIKENRLNVFVENYS